MNHTSFKIAAAALAVASALSSTAYAGGFQLTEQSALALGRAYAGVGVDGTDVSGMYYNAATMTLHPGTQVQFGGVGVGLNLEYVAKDGEKNNGRAKEEVIPHGFISHQIQPGLASPSLFPMVLLLTMATTGLERITVPRQKLL